MQKIYTHYDNLKVARNAPLEVIRAAYKTLSQIHHPDRNSGNPDASRIMAIINASYEVLSDPAKREEHDTWIAEKESKATEQNKPRQNFQSTEAPHVANTSITFKSVISHVFRHWVIYGIVVAVIWGNFTENTYSPPSNPKPYIANPTPETEPVPARPVDERPIQGDIVDGYVFNGGNPNDEKNWRLITEKEPQPKASNNIADVSKFSPNGKAWPRVADYVHGYKKLNTNGLSSVTVDNTQNDSNVFVKLVSLDGAVARPVRQFYIPAYGKFTVNKVTHGSYDVRYRDLNNGGLSRSESFNLEETEIDGGTQFSNYTMTLYKVRNGNMQTYGLSEAEF